LNRNLLFDGLFAARFPASPFEEPPVDFFAEAGSNSGPEAFTSQAVTDHGLKSIEFLFIESNVFAASAGKPETSSC
jgi:hypothetical protein